MQKWLEYFTLKTDSPFVFHKISIVLLCLLDLFLVVLREPARQVHDH